MIDNLNLILSFLWNTLDQVVLLYFSGGILTFAFAVYVVRKVARLLDFIPH